MIDPVRPIAIEDIEAGAGADRGHGAAHAAGEARSRPTAPDIWLKLENLQPTNAYKIRGARQCRRAAVGRRARARACGRSAPAMPGRASLMRRAQFGIPCTVVAIETAPQTKLDRMRGARRDDRAGVLRARLGRGGERTNFPGIDGTFIHPFDNHDFIAGHGTMGLEILEDCPDVAHGHLRDRRRRADHRRRQRDQGAAAGRRRYSAPSPRRRRLTPCRCARAGRGSSPTGRRASSTARAARASPSGCGSGCGR